MSESGDSDKTFEDYDFESDDGWLNVVRRLEFPSQSDAQQKAFIEKRKRRYFKENIAQEQAPVPVSGDSEAKSSASSEPGAATPSSGEPGEQGAAAGASPSPFRSPEPDVAAESSGADDELSSGSPSPDLSSSDQRKSPAAGEQQSGPSQREEPRQRPQPRSSPPPPQPPQQEQKSAPQQQQGQELLTWTLKRRVKVALNYVDWFISIGSILATVSAILPFLVSAAMSYRAALTGVLISNLIRPVVQVLGDKSDSALTWRRMLEVMRNSLDLQLASGAMILLLLQPTSALAPALYLAPGAMRAALFSAACLRPVLANFAPSLLDNARIQSGINAVLSRSEELLRMAASIEVWNAIMLVLLWITPQRNMIVTFMYWSFYLQRLYVRQDFPYMRIAFYNTKVTMNQVFHHPKCPSFVRNVYQKVCDFLYTFVDPQVMRRAQQQQQRCTIM